MSDLIDRSALLEKLRAVKGTHTLMSCIAIVEAAPKVDAVVVKPRVVAEVPPLSPQLPKREYYTTKEAADIVGVTPAHMNRWFRGGWGGIKPHRISGQSIIRKVDFWAWALRNECHGEGERWLECPQYVSERAWAIEHLGVVKC